MCPICKEAKSPILINWKTYHIHRCGSCKLLFTLPLPSDDTLADFYQGFMFKAPDLPKIKAEVANRKEELKRLFEFDGSIDGKRFLDYGAGTGTSFRAATEMGLDTYYYDIDEPAKAFCKAHLGLQDNQIIAHLDDTDLLFDYIFTDNVIEHVKDPESFTKTLLQKLKPNGRLVIKTPNSGNTEIYFNPLMSINQYVRASMKYNSFFTALKTYFVRSWHCDPPRHLYSFTPKSFQAMSTKLEAKGKVSFYGIKWWENTITKEFFSADRKLNIIQSIIYRIVLLPVIIIEILLQLFGKLLLSIGVISAGGLILTIDQD